MTRLTPLFCSKKTLNITYATPRETLLTTPETLPTSEPATPQIGFTVQASDLPTFNITPYRPIYVGRLYGAGKFASAGTLYWRMKKNGQNVSSGSASVSADTFYTVSAHFPSVAVGDLLELALWSSVSDSNWDYKALAIHVTRLIFLNKPRTVADFKITQYSSLPVLTLGNPGMYEIYGFYYWSDDALSCTLYAGDIPTPVLAKAGNTYGFFQILDEGNVCHVRTHSSYRPYYDRYNKTPVSMTFRPFKMDLG